MLIWMPPGTQGLPKYVPLSIFGKFRNKMSYDNKFYSFHLFVNFSTSKDSPATKKVILIDFQKQKNTALFHTIRQKNRTKIR